MEGRDEVIARALLGENEEFRREMEAHQRYEKVLEEFARRPHLSPDDEIEKRKVQKLKLAGKDRMARMILAYRRQHPEPAAPGRPPEE
jgi:uncharacterized protein YdcH (DUF465 family)